MEEGQKLDNEPKPKLRRGFASMSPEKQKEIAAKGGKKAHVMGVAHKWSSEEAKIAGKKGGEIRQKKADKGFKL